MEEPTQEISVHAKIRYGSREVKANVLPLEDGTVKVSFLEPQRFSLRRGNPLFFIPGERLVAGQRLSRGHEGGISRVFLAKTLLLLHNKERPYHFVILGYGIYGDVFQVAEDAFLSCDIPAAFGNMRLRGMVFFLLYENPGVWAGKNQNVF